MQVARFSRSSGETELLTTDDLAELLRLTVRAVYHLRHRGTLPPAVKFGNSLRWRRSDIDDWLENRLDDGTGR